MKGTTFLKAAPSMSARSGLMDLGLAVGPRHGSGGSLTSGGQPFSGAGASGMSQLEIFAERYMDLRDDLAWRAAKGDSLASRERAFLDACDVMLDRLMPSPEPIPEDVRQIMRDVLRER